VRLIRRPVNGGPGAARNTGIAEVRTALVAFLDSDCVPQPGWLAALLPHFADPAVAAAAPRIVSHQPGRTWLGRYEQASSPLDMGRREGIVAAGTRVPYVPTAALVVRTSALGSGFTEELRAGEDVDFVWRLASAGWRVRYEPAATVGHQHRTRLRRWFVRRTHYGTSAAALELRHPGAVRPLRLSGWTALAWLAVLARRPLAGVLVTTVATVLLSRRLAAVTGSRWPLPAPGGGKQRPARDCCYPMPPPADRSQVPPRDSRWLAWRLAVRLAGGGTLTAVRPIGSAISRTWWPVALPAAIAFRQSRLPLAALVLAPPLLDWLDRRPQLDPVRYTAARLLDDLAYSAGAWRGCIRHRTIRPLLPQISLRGARRPASPLS
jgi:hypothetical protein